MINEVDEVDEEDQVNNVVDEAQSPPPSGERPLIRIAEINYPDKTSNTFISFGENNNHHASLGIMRIHHIFQEKTPATAGFERAFVDLSMLSGSEAGLVQTEWPITLTVDNGVILPHIPFLLQLMVMCVT